MRLLIVDDEHHIVNYLAALIEEHAPSELEIYKCYSGIDALELLKSFKIDLILLDIHMPGLSGIETATQAMELLPKCHIIFLTAYDTFDHIYETNKIKHTRYLLKTETDEMILKEIFSTISTIQNETDKLHLISEAEKKAILLSHLLQQNILKGILTGRNIDKLKSEFSLIGSSFVLDLEEPVYLIYTQIYYKTLDESNLNSTTYTLQYLQLMDNLLLGKFLFTMLNLEGGTMLWFFQPVLPSSNDFEFLKNTANDFEDYCSSTLHHSIAVVLYPTPTLWSQICNHFHVMQQYIETSITKVSLIYSSVNVLENNILEPSSPPSVDHSSIERQLQELSFHLYQGSSGEYLTLLGQLRDKCVKIKSMHDLNAIKVYTSISLLLMNYISLYHLQKKISSRLALYPLYYIQDFSSWQNAFDYIQNLSLQIFKILDTKKVDKNETLVNTIESYIKEHLPDSLTLTTISGVVNYNATYISRLFKQLTGMSLSDYISQERIKEAKYLLSSTNESMQNIATATGFDTSQYFSIVFKKTVGLSPSEYRRSHL